jgi:hypothetical protein
MDRSFLLELEQNWRVIDYVTDLRGLSPPGGELGQQRAEPIALRGREQSLALWLIAVKGRQRRGTICGASRAPVFNGFGPDVAGCRGERSDHQGVRGGVPEDRRQGLGGLRMERFPLLPGTYDITASLTDFTLAHPYDVRRNDVDHKGPVEPSGIVSLVASGLSGSFHFGREPLTGSPLCAPGTSRAYPEGLGARRSHSMERTAWARFAAIDPHNFLIKVARKICVGRRSWKRCHRKVSNVVLSSKVE